MLQVREWMPSKRDTSATHHQPVSLPCVKAVAKQAGEQRGVQFDASQVVIGPGAKPALFFPTLAVVQPGDEVLYPDPGFPTYPAMVLVAGGIPIPVPLREENDFSFDLDAFDRLVSEKTKMIILNSPSNPTGGVMPLMALEHIAEVARQRNIWVLSDEIYARLVFETPAPSIVSLPGMLERTIICDGFLKNLCDDRLAARIWDHA